LADALTRLPEAGTVKELKAQARCFWFPISRLGTPLQAKLLLCEKIIYFYTGRPKQEHGNEGKTGCAALSRRTPYVPLRPPWP